MPAPTKIWGESTVYNEQPPDGFLEDGNNPELPWPTRFVNWTLNFIWSTLGVEHNPFTGAHTDITATSVAGGVVTYDSLTSNNNTPANTVIPAKFTYKATEAIIQQVYAADWTLAPAPVPYLSDHSGFLIGDDAAIGTEFAALDLGAAIPIGGGGTTVLSTIAVRVGRLVGTTTTADWALLSRPYDLSAAWTTVASGTLSSATIVVETDPTPSEVINLGGSLALTLDFLTTRYMLSLSVATEGSSAIYFLETNILYTRTQNRPV